MANQQLRNVTGHVVIQSEFVPEALLRNVTGHVVIQSEFAPAAVLRNVTGHVVIQQHVEFEPPPGEGGEAEAPRRLSSGLGIGV